MLAAAGGMSGFGSWDAAAFRFVNQTLSNPLFDGCMPFLSGNAFFAPALLVLAAALVCKGGVRGRLCVLMLVLVVGLADNWVAGSLKHLFARPRPFLSLPAVNELVGRGGTFSMPSSHAANWFCGSVVAALYYRRSLWVMLPLAGLVSFSRVYNGVHYPGDVLAGALVGAGVGFSGAWGLNWLWQVLGSRAFPLWWRRLPSLLHPEQQRDPLAWQAAQPAVRAPEVVEARQWLRLSGVLLGAVLLARLLYLAYGRIELSEDEAYQWLWSKHLDLSYYSKPPLIAYTQFLGTALWGDNAFGIRFFSPVIAAGLGWLLLRFFAREFSPRAACFLLLTLLATPLLAVGSVLMTIDPLSVLFWSAAMLAGWRAVQAHARTRDWLWVGLWLGLGFLGKYTALLQWVSFALFFCLWPPARRQLRRPGPYLALLVCALSALPVFIWNARHGWITLDHLHERAGLTATWRPTLRFWLDFALAETALLNPVFFGGMLWAIVAVWRKRRHNPLLIYFLCMGAPVLFGYWAYTLRARVQPNWIAPAVIPLLCLLVAYADSRWRAGARAVRGWFWAGLAPGLLAVVLGHDTNLINKLCGRPLPARLDPLRRVRGWQEAARIVGEVRQSLLAEGRPVFLISDHYGTTSLLTFYLPEAKAGVPDAPLAYHLSSERPLNQFYFWPGYRGRKGENALFVTQTDTPQPPPEALEREFASVRDLGLRDVAYRGRVLRRLQLFACRDLR